MASGGHNYFQSQSGQEHNAQTKANILNILDYLPGFLKMLVKPLAGTILSYILGIDDNYTLDIADQRLSGPEYNVMLKTIGAHMEDFRKSKLCNYFNTDTQTFSGSTSSVSGLNAYVSDVVTFCASIQDGKVNTTAVKNILSTLLKEELRRERTTIDITDTQVVYSSKSEGCGVLKLVFTGNKIETTNCCSSETETTMTVQKTAIMFNNTQELLCMVKTFANAYSQT